MSGMTWEQEIVMGFSKQDVRIQRCVCVEELESEHVHVE